MLHTLRSEDVQPLWKLIPISFTLIWITSSVGARSRMLWCQIFADVMNVEIKQVADPIYANACGAAVGLGEIKFADIPAMIQFRRVYQPKFANRAVYDRGFENFQLIYKQMKNVYRRLNQ